MYNALKINQTEAVYIHIANSEKDVAITLWLCAVSANVSIAEFFGDKQNDLSRQFLCIFKNIAGKNIETEA